MQFWTSKHC